MTTPAAPIEGEDQPLPPDGEATPEPSTDGEAGHVEQHQEQPDYKALYEQTQAQLAKARTRARKARTEQAAENEQQTAEDDDADKVRRRAARAEERAATLVQQLVRAEVRAAASDWAAPDDAYRYLDDLSAYANADGEIDTDAITADVHAELLARPHLRRSTGPRPPAPDLSQGARASGAVGAAAQIREAEARGDWATAISLKNQRLAELARERR
ncbi:hypothetical protein NLX83_13775 [Allokutzneria sp. A3M-2-11 16]|uniref:hypothetical protein n=1 Tax=Allokutzneria sp. A3M-2-11 16 TaxID=2962043 RepID=UPI0020B8544E|nr:hypothetical protein [Allokutzneria sp. A3M-2-11 16]MCP3800328.1 hypothetical protein [Allokutzneria sp. A3M-2-11 16]